MLLNREVGGLRGVGAATVAIFCAGIAPVCPRSPCSPNFFLLSLTSMTFARKVRNSPLALTLTRIPICEPGGGCTVFRRCRVASEFLSLVSPRSDKNMGWL